MASLTDGHHVLAMRHSVLPAAASAEGPLALLHLTVLEAHGGSVAAGLQGPKEVALELTAGQLDSLVTQLQRVAGQV
jgi:hypothetical protein